MYGARWPLTMAEIGPGDHLCFLYGTSEEHRSVVSEFLRNGLNRGERLVYVYDEHPRELILDYLRNDFSEPETLLLQKRLILLAADSVYLRGGAFNPRETFRLLNEIKDQSLAEGFSGLRIAGETGWAARDPSHRVKLLEYEAASREFYAGGKCTAICQYNRDLFPPDTLLQVLKAHPIAVLGTMTCENFYYEPTLDDLGTQLDNRLRRLEGQELLLKELRRRDESVPAGDDWQKALFTDSGLIKLLIDPEDGGIVHANQAARNYYGYPDLREKNIAEIEVVSGERSSEEMQYNWLREKGKFESRHRLASGEIRDVDITSGPVTVGGRELLCSVIHDITDQKSIKHSLEKRTGELEAKAREIEALNTTLEVLLKRREQDREQMVENIRENIKEIITPFLEKLDATRLDEVQRTYLDVIKSGLLEIGSPFMKMFSHKHPNLSPMEVRVATLISAGKENKEIAEALGVSVNTITVHRYHLRTKLGIKGAKVNLKSYLDSLLK